MQLPHGPAPEASVPGRLLPRPARLTSQAHDPGAVGKAERRAPSLTGTVSRAISGRGLVALSPMSGQPAAPHRPRQHQPQAPEPCWLVQTMDSKAAQGSGPLLPVPYPLGAPP